MPDSFLISPPEKPDSWTVAPGQFEQLVRSMWPEARFTRNTEPGRPFPFAAYIEGDRPLLMIALNGDQTSVMVEGSLDEAVRMALAWRREVPSDAPLLFYDQGFNSDVEVTIDSTAEDLAAPFMA